MVLNRPIGLACFKICTENMYTMVGKERERGEPMRITITKAPKWYKNTIYNRLKILILMRVVYDLYRTNYKTLLKETNKNLNNGEV